MDKKQELKRVKQEVKKALEFYGYKDNVSDKVIKVTEYFRGVPSKVLLKDGTELYL